MKLGDGPIQTVKVFKYLVSTFAAEGGSETDVNNRVKAAWAKWREVAGVMCDKKMPIKLKDKIYKTIVKPAMIYGSECWAVKKNAFGHPEATLTIQQCHICYIGHHREYNITNRLQQHRDPESRPKRNLSDVSLQTTR